ncbi:hypothetical protein AB4851_30165 [Burkholderia sp. 22PA0099]|uniref:hypothetical protein n=1 Tax=Burkholderia sp. 22PA0099 TaxID=3237372 RepID=UPI0039C01A76
MTKPKISIRHWILALGLVGAVAAAIHVSSSDDGVDDVVGAAANHVRNPQVDPISVTPTTSGASVESDIRKNANRSSGEVRLVVLQTRHFETNASTLFAGPEPAKPINQTAPKPVAPPLPFKMLGRLTDGSGIAVLLAANGADETLAHEGDTVNGSYRLDSIKTNALIFTYLPTQTRQTLALDAGPDGTSNEQQGINP